MNNDKCISCAKPLDEEGFCTNMSCKIIYNQSSDEAQSINKNVTKSKVSSQNEKSSTLLGMINLIVFSISAFGSLLSILFSFNQCADNSGYCEDYSQFTNWTQFAISVAYFLVSLLIFAFVAAFDNYVNRKN